ncbi:MAG TPA: BREX system Lon protease-like protein BrxL [Planctomycetaceae bacterium]|nr:BREX system Lon protease-like protein BrxL [Planctomycetaceae bacterium]
MANTFQLDRLDNLAAKHLDGYLVRKDLVRTFSRQFPVPTYVVEFMLGRYCASMDEEEIEEGLEIVQKQLVSRTVKSGDEELFKARAKEDGEVKIIDNISAKVDPRRDAYVAYLPSLQLSDIRVDGRIVNENERMLTGGFFAEVTLCYDSVVGKESKLGPFAVSSLREIQLSSRNVLETLGKAREDFTTDEWKKFLLRSIGLEADEFGQKQMNAHLLRMVPFVERNYNMVELGPRGTGKSHLFQQVSPYARLISGGKATVAQMFVNNASGKRGLVCQYDVICFDEVSGIKFDQKDGVNIMKGYMESGEFSRGKESIRADGGIVLVGNFDVDVEHQMRIGHLFGPLPPEMRDDTAFMDRIHAFLPGWDVPKVNKSMLTNHFGLVSDFLSECWSQLRRESRVSSLQNRIKYGAALSGRDTNAVNKTVSGLLKLLYPLPSSEVPDDELRWAVEIGLECRRRVKEQQKFIGKDEYGDTDFSYEMVQSGDVYWVPTTEREAKLLEPATSEPIEQTGHSAVQKQAKLTPDDADEALGTFCGYALVRGIDGGGMSETFVAREESTGEEYFLKRVRVQSADTAALERESRIYEKLTRLRAQHVVDVIDFIRGDSYLALVTELADGGDLDSFINNSVNKGELDTKEVKKIGLQVAYALKELHANDIVHRDLKPANILRFGDAWKVADFGIAKNMSRLVSNQTFRGGGTRGFKAPEQHQGANAHPSADIYSLGKTFAFLATGQTDVDMVPFDGWRNLIRKCLAFSPADRPSIDEVIAELQALPV